MKKLMTLVAAVALATAANAMAAQWAYYDDGSEFAGARVYMLLSAPADSYASEAAIANVGFGTISGGLAAAAGKDDSITKDSDFTAYFVIATDEGFYTSDAYTIASSYVYNPGEQENPKSTFEAGTADGISDFKAWGGSPEPTPEPTSGLLLLLGVAGLALRRKRA